MRREIILSSFILAAVIAIYASLSLFDEPGAAIFPRVVIIAMAILSSLLLIRSVIVGRAGTTTSAMEFRFRPFLICFVLIVIYFFLLDWIGFYVASFLFFLAVTFVFGLSDISLRKGALKVLSSAVFMGVLYFLFTTLLKVQIPKGVLF
jgi:hypothetical protein